MNLLDLNQPRTLKFISLFILSLLGLMIIRSQLPAWEIPRQLNSPVIPQSFVRKMSRQFLMNGLIMLSFFIPGLICWKIEKYKATIIIAIVGFVGYFIHFHYFWE